MRKISCLAILLTYSFSFLTASAAPPAPAEKGIAGDGPEVTQIETKKPAPMSADKKEESAPKPLQQQIADLEIALKALRESQKEIEHLQGNITILKAENTGLATRLKTVEDDKTTLANRVKRLEADNLTLQEDMRKVVDKLADLNQDTAKRQFTAKPAFVHSAVRFYNHEGNPLRMNVNGVWHTLKPGENDIWVAYGPVHIYRYTGAEPKLFWDWKPYKNGYLMEFDVGQPAQK